MTRYSPYDLSFYRQPGPKHLESLIIQITKDIGAKRVLDVGAGSGWLVKALRKNNINAYGCDNSKLAIKKNLVVWANATKLPFEPKKFNLITAISLIEHLTPAKADKFLAEVKRTLKPRGFLFLVTPNFASPLKLIQGKKWHGYHDSTHINFYTPSSLKKTLRKNGFGHFQTTFPAPSGENFEWTLPTVIKNLPKPIKKILNFLAYSTFLNRLKNSFSILAQVNETK